jgi:hypothetical protein
MVHSSIFLHTSNKLTSNPNSTKLQTEKLSLKHVSKSSLPPWCKYGLLFRVAFVCQDIQSMWEMQFFFWPNAWNHVELSAVVVVAKKSGLYIDNARYKNVVEARFQVFR